MPRDVRGKPIAQVENPPALVDRIRSPHVLVVIPTEDESVVRDGDVLKQHLKELPIDSVEDFCSQIGLKISETIEDENGNPQVIDIPVRNAETFTPSGMTRSHPELHRMYVYMRTQEDIARVLSSEDREYLDEQEVGYLKDTLAYLTNAQKGGDQ